MVTKEIMNKFGLYHKRENIILNYRTSPNRNADFCGTTQYLLCKSGGIDLWLVDDAYNAAYVRKYSTPWYNACYETPTSYFEAEELEVVAVEVKINTTPIDIKVPTMSEYLEIKYKETERPHYDYCMKNIKGLSPYNLYEFFDLLRDNKWPVKEKGK